MSKKFQIIIISIFVLAGFSVFLSLTKTRIFKQEAGLATLPSALDLSNIVLPAEFQFKDETIPLTWTDDNTGENLIIQSDRKYYDGRDSSEVYFSITNISDKDQKPDIKFLFDKKEGRGTKEIALLNSQNDVIASGQTNFYKAVIYYPQNSKGEFFIEAKGDKGGYGYLDPYYASGLVGMWSFSGKDTNWTSATAGTTNDLSGNNNTGTMTNMSRNTSPVPGISGQALKFDGVDDHVSAGDPADGRLDTGTSDFSLSVWVYTPTKDNNSHNIVVKWAYNEIGNSGFGLVTRFGRYTMQMGIIHGVGVCNAILWYGSNDSTNDLVAGVWEHVTATFDRDGYARLYVNGAESYSKDISASSACDLSNSYPFFIGSRGIEGSPDSFFNGSIDEVRIYNRALSASEITDLYRVGAARLKVNTPKTLAGPSGGLVGNWSFNGPDIDWKTGTAYDRSGSGNNGTITNMSTTTSPVAGISGQALKFDGVDDHVSAGDPADGRLDTGTSDFSLSVWVYTPTKDNNSHNIVVKWAYNEIGNSGFGLVTRFGRYTMQMGIIHGVGVCNAILWYGSNDSTNDLVAGVWEHVTATFDRDGYARLYVNGAESYSKDISASSACDLSNSYPFFIGSRGIEGSPDSFFNGSIDEVRIYNRALSASEITDLYRVGAARLKVNTPKTLAGPSGGLVGNWSFNGPDIDWKTGTAYDRSGSGNNGTITNMSTTTSPVAGISGQALKFDGSDDVVSVNDNDALDFATSDFSFSAWVFTPVGAATGATIFGKWSYSTTVGGWSFVERYDVAKYGLQLGKGEAPCQTIWYVGFTTDVTEGVWEHIFANIDRDGYAKLYLNGVYSSQVDISADASCDYSNAYDFQIGSRGSSGYRDEYFKGSVDEVRVYNRVLSADEIGQLYRAGASRVEIRQ